MEQGVIEEATFEELVLILRDLYKEREDIIVEINRTPWWHFRRRWSLSKDRHMNVALRMLVLTKIGELS